jgi:hypothetical protein
MEGQQSFSSEKQYILRSLTCWFSFWFYMILHAYACEHFVTHEFVFTCVYSIPKLLSLLTFLFIFDHSSYLKNYHIFHYDLFY